MMDEDAGLAESTVHTAYTAEQARQYDRRRFVDAHGRLFARLETEQLRRALTALAVHASVLEVGCGTGRFLPLVLEAGHSVHAVEPSAAMLKEASARTESLGSVTYVQGEGGSLPFDSQAFDFVYAIRVLNQVASRQYALQVVNEMLRVCREDGLVLVEFVNRWGLTISRQDVQISPRDVGSVVRRTPGATIRWTAGIMFFSLTAMKLMPVFCLPMFERLDRLAARAFPYLCTRCYMLIRR